MKSKMFFRKALSVLMAAVVSASTVFPVYAADMDNAEPVTETDVGQMEVETVESEPVAETEADSEEETKKAAEEELDASDLYALCLPKMEDVSYSYDKDRLYSELSDSTMDVLVYEAGEHVSVTVKTDSVFSVVDGYSEDVFLSEKDISDGKLSFSMPETDLILQFKAVDDQEVETGNSAETEIQTEVQSEDPELQEETEAIVETESETEIQTEVQTTEQEFQADTEEKISEAETQPDSELEKQTETKDIFSVDDTEDLTVYPEAGSTMRAASQNVYFKDKGFDYKNYTPNVEYVDDVHISWEKGELNFEQEGTYDIIYKATLKSDDSYSWFIDVPMEIVPEKDAATATSDNFENKIFLNKEQSDEFTGKVPKNNGDHITGPDVETVKGENFKLKDVNLGYDMNIFVYDVAEDGGFDPDKSGVYNVIYSVTSYQTPDIEFFVDCKVTVKENIENKEPMTVHVVSTELKASISDADGNTYEAAYGSDVISDKVLKKITVKPAWQGVTEIDPVITVLKNGEKTANDEIIENKVKDGINYIFTLNSDMDVSSDKYVFLVDYPSFDPQRDGIQKSEDRRTDDFVDPVEEFNEGSDDEYGIATIAASKEVSKTWTGTSNKSGVSNGRNSCTNYGWQYDFTGYRKYTLNFSSDFKKSLDEWVASQGADFEGKVPSSVTIQCAEGGGTHMAWNGFCGSSLSIKATLKFNSDGDPTRLTLRVNAPGKSTNQGNYQRYSGSKTVPLQPATGELKIVKTSRGKFTAQFENVNLLAKFTLYTDEECTDEYDSIRLVPDDDSSAKATAVMDEIEPGKYWLKETRIAEGHRDDQKVYPVTIENGETTTVNVANTPYFFDGQFIAKKTADTNAALAGAVFKVTGTCEKKNLGTWYFKTGSKGEIKYSEDYYLAKWNSKNSSKLIEYGVGDIKYALPKDTVLKMVEVEAPKGYSLDEKEYTTTTKVEDKTVARLTCSLVTVKDSPDEGKLVLWKKDSELGANVPNTSDYSLANAKFSVKDESGKVVAVLVTDKTGKTNEVTLKTGKYTVQETTAPLGYKVNPKAENVTIKVNQTTTVKVQDDSKRGSLDIHKKLDPEEPDAIKKNLDLTKITFRLSYKRADGKTIYAKDASGSANLHPDKKGNLHVSDLYYGTWTLTELNSVTYHEPMDPEEIVISSKDTSSVDYTVENYRYKSLLEIIKKDLDTGETIPRAGCSFKIKDAAGNYVSLDVDNSGRKVDTFVTSKKGLVDVYEKIPAGKYTLVETVPPAGYKLANPVSFEVTGKESKAIIEMHDKRVATGISVEKKDSVSGKSAGAGFKFNIIADEAIKDASGTVYKGFSAGSVVDTIVTDASGVAKSKVALYPGKYHIKEVSSADNYLNDAKDVAFTVVEKKTGETWVAEVQEFDGKIISVNDTPIMRPIQVQKTDSLSGNAAGAKFTFTVKADKVVDGSGVTRKGFETGTVIDTITTDGRGIATSKNLYCGTYIVTETVRNQNYVLSTKEYKVQVSDNNKTAVPVVVQIKDDPVRKKISVTKIDQATGNHCGEGYKFQITAAEDIVDGSGAVYNGYHAGDVVDTIVTDKNGIATSKELLMGKYFIQEIEVSDDGGMAINETKYPFSLADEKDKDGNLADVKDTDKVMIIPITDIADVPTTLNIKKLDSLLDKNGNSIIGEDGQPIDGAEPRALEGITFRVKAKGAENSDDQLHVTDKEGNIKVEYLKRNTTYTIQETKTIPGYNLDDTVHEFTVDEKGLINGESSYSVTLTNQPNVVHISKVDITNSEEISGAKMELTDLNGNVIDEWTSDGKPHVIYGLADGQYRLVESVAPDKYEVATSVTQGNLPTDENEKANIEGLNSEGIFTIKDSMVVQQITMKDSPYRWVELSKKEITGDDELPGCTLTVRDSHGDVVDTWVSTTEPHKLQLHSGVYSLTEEKPADGYVTTDTINFEVIQTNETDYGIQTVTMRDEVTKITVSKKDITNDEEVPGAHLVIKNENGDIVEEWTSTNETHYVEKLPIGKYTLTEITAPEGYETAETISFEIKDTGEIQHYEMFDSPYRPVEVSKKDITNKEELPGANLEIRDADNNVVDSWISTSESHKVSLPHGKYTLIETKPADGFTTAESINFEVLERNTKEEDGVEVQHVEMEDDVTKVQISKQDVTTKKELPGAKLQIKDKDGNVIEEWTSTNEVHYIEKLPIGEYILTETTAPNGYDVAENVNFKVLDTNEIQHVIMYDSPTVTPGTNTPKTGDINPTIPVVAGIIVIALAGIGIVLIRKKKTK